MTKKNKRNASSFYEICDIERGEVINKIRLPKGSIEKFSMSKTNLFKTNMDDIFVIRDSGKLLDLKLGRK